MFHDYIKRCCPYRKLSKIYKGDLYYFYKSFTSKFIKIFKNLVLNPIFLNVRNHSTSHRQTPKIACAVATPPPSYSKRTCLWIPFHLSNRGHSGCSYAWLNVNNVAINMKVQILVKLVFLVPSGKYPEMEFLHYMVILFSVF